MQGNNNGFTSSVWIYGTSIVIATAILLILGLISTMPATAIESTVVSSDSDGNPGDLGPAYIPSLSADGRFIVFDSYATNLIPDDQNGYTSDIFLKDVQTGNLSLISSDSAGSQADTHSLWPTISADGRYVAFSSAASNLVPGDDNGEWDIFLKDTFTGTTNLISSDASGLVGNRYSTWPDISSDGRYVSFASNSTNFVPESTGWNNIYVKDRITGNIVLASETAAGVKGNSSSSGSALSADGRYVVFESYASNLVDDDTNVWWDIFRKDLQTGEIIRVSTTSTGGQANSGSHQPRVSGDGRFIVFVSEATNLFANDTNGKPDIFLKDVQTGMTTRVSGDIDGVLFSDTSQTPQISLNGRYIIFEYYSGVAFRDMASGNLTKIWHAGRTKSNMSADGRFVTVSDSQVRRVGTPAIADCVGGRPLLGLGLSKVYWASYEDYLTRELSIDYSISNDGADHAFAGRIISGAANNGVTVLTPSPISLGNLMDDTSYTFIKKYSIPAGTAKFAAEMQVSAQDQCGASYSYP